MSENTVMTDAATTSEGASDSQAAASVATDTATQQQQATDTQTTQDAANTAEGDSDAGDKGEKADAYGAPEKYELKAPEATPWAQDAESMQRFEEFARDLDLSQEAAQQMLDKLAPAMVNKQLEAVNKIVDQWGESTKADKEIGGEQLNENLSVAKKALDAFGSPELRALLGKYDAEKNPKGTGLGNHPEVIRLLYRAGKAISEDTVVPAGSGNPKQTGGRDYASSLYPNQPR